MSKLVIQGPARLDGTIKVGGSKNAALAILPATLLATRPVTLHNVPAIRDVRYMLSILKEFGMGISGDSGTVTLDPVNLKSSEIPDDLARHLRASITLLGPALARFGRVSMPHPGGDYIGKRPVTMHFHGLSELGGKVDSDNTHYVVSAKALQGREIFFEEASVTATETVMAGAAVARGTTVLRNAASELHVQDLARFLNMLGARITGAGTNHIVIEGVAELGGGEHRIRPDEIETGTFVIAAAMTGGDVTLTDTDPENLGLILRKFREVGVRFKTTADTIRVTGQHRLRATNLKTNLWPAFPSDLQSPYTVLMTQAEGMCLLQDHLYEGRFFFTDKLMGMGANITIADPHRVIVFGPTKLRGKELESPDIRAGISVLLAALVAEGQTTIDHAEIIDRGYEKIEERLASLGVDIQRLTETTQPV